MGARLVKRPTNPVQNWTNQNQSGSAWFSVEPKDPKRDPIDSKKSPDKENPSSSKDSSKTGANSSSGKSPVKGPKHKKTSKSTNKPPIAPKTKALINLSNKYESLMDTDDPISAKCIPIKPLVPRHLYFHLSNGESKYNYTMELPRSKA